MSEVDESQYPQSYGRYGRAPDFTRCAAVLFRDIWSVDVQCSRKNGHGKGSAWCKQHDPVVLAAKTEAVTKQWKEQEAKDRAERQFTNGCKIAIKMIAGGHEDPRALAQSIIDDMNEAMK